VASQNEEALLALALLDGLISIQQAKLSSVESQSMMERRYYTHEGNADLLQR
jgi:hypothetical protein